ncbi:MAG: hypothetical protein AAGD00_10675 [Planctomycetota bacterium]
MNGARALIALVLVALVGCGTSQRTITDVPAAQLDEWARAHNAEVARFDTLWARGVISIAWTEPDGDSRYEQGNAHLQFDRDQGVALSVNKLGDTYLWFGSDGDRSWVIEPRDDRARIASPGPGGNANDAFVFDPVHMIGLLGLGDVPLPDDPGVRTQGATLSVDRETLGWSYGFDPQSGRLVGVRVEDERGLLASASLSEPLPVVLPEEGGFFPLVASSARIEYVRGGGGLLRLTLETLEARAITPAVFDVEFLVGPDVYDIDAVEYVEPSGLVAAEPEG